MTSTNNKNTDKGLVAIVAMAGRFGSADNPDELWNSVFHGQELVKDLTDKELENSGVAQSELSDPAYVKRGAFLNEPTSFDAQFFGYTPKEAIRMDPQHRILLELCHEALESSGYGPGTFAGDIGVYIGTKSSTWLPMIQNFVGESLADLFSVQNGNAPDAVATRIAYKLNCTGPALNIQTFCSSSLVAIHLACQQLLNNECDLALAGGASVRFPQNAGYKHFEGGILSRTGKCRAFDSLRDGVIFSDAAGIVVLRRLEDAQSDRNPILAIIRGSAISNDGSERAGYTAPGCNGQVRNLKLALDRANAVPEDIGLVEAHGTGTPIGDAIEFRALMRTFGESEFPYCGLGSVKTNLGHADCASGIAGLVKVIKTFQHRVIPPSLHFTTPSHDINLQGSPFFVPTQLTNWDVMGKHRLALVNSLGIGGTNATLIVESPPEAVHSESRECWHLLPISAQNEVALNKISKAMADFLETTTSISLADVAFTLQRGRRPFLKRYVAVVQNKEEAILSFTNMNGLTHAGSRVPENIKKIAKEWIEGKKVDWAELYQNESRSRIKLPTYPFDRQYYGPKTHPVIPEGCLSSLSHQAKNDQALNIAVEEKRVLCCPRENGDTHMYSNVKIGRAVDAGKVLDETTDIFARSLEMDSKEVDINATLQEIGADSIMLVDALGEIKEKFGVVITMRQILSELIDIKSVTAYILENLPTESFTQDPRDSSTPEVTPIHTRGRGSTDNNFAKDVINEQLRLMEKQLDVLRGGLCNVSDKTEVIKKKEASKPADNFSSCRVKEEGRAASTILSAGIPSSQSSSAPQVIENDARLSYLSEFIPAYTQRTQKSKAYGGRFRTRIADSRSSIGFKPSIKEMLYPIVADEANGAIVKDIDGNSYIDMTMGFGVHLLGHNPPLVKEALIAHQKSGFSLGTRSETTLEVAELFLKLTGMDRMAFVNSGTEAVMTALRVARAATKKDNVVLFSYCYHGHADGVLAAPVEREGRPCARPLAAGIPECVMDSVTVLEFGSQESLDYIRENAADLAAVIIEPIPTRKPALNDRAFLTNLRETTQESGVLLIFDEMVTGFRCHPGGVQGLYNIKADIATYGKIIGGGLPLGIIAGRAGVLDAIDGGVWHYGDMSGPYADSTFFGGTFNQHPLAMTAARAILRILDERGEALQERLTARTDALVNKLNSWFETEEFQVSVQSFSSFFKLVHKENLDLLYYNLLHRGVYIWEWRCWFISDAHTDEQLDFVCDAIKSSMLELRDKGLLASKKKPITSAENQKSSGESGETYGETEILPFQQEVYAGAILEGSSIYNEALLLDIRGEVDTSLLVSSLKEVVQRHPMLRARLTEDGKLFKFSTFGEIEYKHILIKESSSSVKRFAEENAFRSFDFQNGPVVRLCIGETSPTRNMVLIAISHIFVDGIAFSTAMKEWIHIYNAKKMNNLSELPIAIVDANTYLSSIKSEPAKKFWKDLFGCKIPKPISFDVEDSALPQALGCHHFFELDDQIFDKIVRTASINHATPFIVFFSLFSAWLHCAYDRDSIVVSTPYSLRDAKNSNAVCNATVRLPIPTSLVTGMTFSGFTKQVRDTLLSAFEHPPLGVRWMHTVLGTKLSLSEDSLFRVEFNMDPGVEKESFYGTRLSVLDINAPLQQFDFAEECKKREKIEGPYTKCDLILSVFKAGKKWKCAFGGRKKFFSEETLALFEQSFRDFIAASLENPDASLKSVSIQCPQAKILEEKAPP